MLKGTLLNMGHSIKLELCQSPLIHIDIIAKQSLYLINRKEMTAMYIVSPMKSIPDNTFVHDQHQSCGTATEHDNNE